MINARTNSIKKQMRPLKAIISVGGKKHPVEFKQVIDLYVLIDKYVKGDWILDYSDCDHMAKIVSPKAPGVYGTVRLLDGRFRIRGYVEGTVDGNNVI